ncbi:MAG TPA: hypothetical protein VIH73_04280 [Acidimicrobiales bacterium]
MTLARLDVRFVALDALVEEANTRHVVVALTDADTIVAVGSLHDRLTKPLGVWLELSEDYSAQMAARDVATLSWLVPLDTVVVSAPSAEGSAQVVEALLSDDEVNFTNGVATLIGAYNRPAPPAPIAVWSWDGALLRRGDEALREASSASGRDFDETTYP